MAGRLLSKKIFKPTCFWNNITSPLYLQHAHTNASTKEAIIPITKLLIANRGEIACRVMQSATRMGIQNVACYSDADKNSLHTLMADEAYYIGNSPAVESYLCMDKIINVAKESGAHAIHPGYGFLSEKPEFANLCEKEGIIFIGPPSNAILNMGIKSTSKKIMGDAGVPIIEGYHGDDQNITTLKAEAERIGYPVMLKAVRGGGGKGMRIVMNSSEFESALESAKNESLKAFDDDKMLVEKFVQRPRHVEVQVFADAHGNTVYLFERDCSVQRRHQKIIEEAPAPGLSAEVRRQIGEAAVRAAKAVGYVGAGTVEFIMDENQDFYFMEMNTRLQVEHPVSEMITGVDLVELQIRAASGERLPFTQDDLSINGHSFEARIYAEDPDSDFMPGTGELHYLTTPSASDDVRIETGVRQGDEVSQYYDPMIAKLVVWDKCRSSALQKLQNKLQDYHIVGLSTNLKFLTDLAAHPSFKAGDVHTDFIDEHFKELFPPKNSLTRQQIVKAALALLLQQRRHVTGVQSNVPGKNSPFFERCSFLVNMEAEDEVSLFDGDAEIKVQVAFLKEGILLKIGEEEFMCDGTLTQENVVSATVNGKKEKYSVVTKDESVFIFTKDEHFQVSRQQPRFIQETIEAAAPKGGVVAPMTGTILEVRVNVGDEVKAGDTVAVIYAMKLEHNILAPSDGTIEEIFVQQGHTANHNDELIKIKRIEEDESS